ncbi:hypothetical protein [Actinoplanes sp. NPDC051494]|uniref:hypothetical protein n=1 Tax=Actinoplanes sp. NPDC051494 TaxID=3363907 RepID=UPI0037887895
MRLRGIGSAGLVLAVVATGGCSIFDNLDGEPQVVEIVAGGGEQVAGPAKEAAVRGRLVSMVMGADGALNVLTEDHLRLAMWTVRGGQLTHVVVKDVEPDYISQAAAGPDGSVYVSLWNGDGGVWQIGADGSAVQKVKNGVDVHGVAVDTGSRMYYAEDRPEPVRHQVVRAGDKTVLGRELTGATVGSGPGTRSGFTNGTKATDITVDGGLNLPLAVSPDGSVFAGTSRESVILVQPDGATRKIAGGGEDGYPEEPFLDRGRAVDAAVHVRENGGFVTDRDGALYVVSDSYEWGYLSGAFDWTGEASAAQREMLTWSRDQRDTDTEVLRVAPGGSLTTVAGHADAVAVDDEWIYLARAFTTEETNEERVVVVRTANFR